MRHKKEMDRDGRGREGRGRKGRGGEEKLVVLVHTSDPYTQEAETGGS